jgi:drug/metabolite transporter (DMT)-like permease
MMLDRSSVFGVLIMLAVAALGAIDAVVVRLVSHDVHPVFMVFARSIFGLLAMMPWIMRYPGMLKTKRFGLHSLRATLKLMSLGALFVAMTGAPLATVTTLGFMSPIFVMVGAWFVFREQPKTLRIAAAIFGFVGVIIVKGPSNSEFSYFLILALVSALLTATIQLILKYMGKSEGADTLVAWNLIVSVPIALVPALWFWCEPTPFQWMLLALQGANGAISQLLVTKAFQLADASLVAPVDFMRLPSVAVCAFLFFGEVANQSTWIGAALIFVALVLIAISSRKPSLVKAVE